MIDKLKTGIYKDKIRITPDNKYVSIFDLINIVVGILNPRKCWYDILHP